MNKSTRHSKITGDFAEAIVLYWLSKYGHECARIDHTGIDLIARDMTNSKLMGISVKARSRYQGTESKAIVLPVDGFSKARQACKAFHCVPYYAIVIDGYSTTRCFFMSQDHLEDLTRSKSKGRYWQMSPQWLDKYANDPEIQQFELQTKICSWRDCPTNKTKPPRIT